MVHMLKARSRDNGRQITTLRICRPDASLIMSYCGDYKFVFDIHLGTNLLFVRNYDNWAWCMMSDLLSNRAKQQTHESTVTSTTNYK
jgi:hypothetical protein